tara:strand:- start:706 stop:1029 length:324 start_codon:yes stop_codon:yes gene_type:complete
MCILLLISYYEFGFCFYKLLNTFKKIFKLTLIFSTVISAWATIILVSNTTFSLEINEVIKKMYLNQRNFIFNVKELSLLLVRDANERFSKVNKGVTPFDNKENGFLK